jgi:phospholipase C
MHRRDFLKAGAGVAGVAAFGRAAAACAPAPGDLIIRGPGMDAGIKHIVVVMMENRSFDHFLGWLPGANTFDRNKEYLDSSGVGHAPWRFDEWTSCHYEDPDHSREGGFAQLNGGACDGFLKGYPDIYPVSYHTADQLAFWGPAAPAWTVCDNYFTGLMAPTWPNRFFQHCGQTDRLDNKLRISSMTTIWDKLRAYGLEGRYYFSDAPFAALLGLRHLEVSRTLDQFHQDAAGGRLPHLSFVDPGFILEAIGGSSDYHPQTDIRLGDQFLHGIYEAVTTSPAWENTVLVVNFDEWGGFFDHVAPTEGQHPDPGNRQRGFRTPCLVASPFARRGHIAHDLYDHASVLRMVEWAFDLDPLTKRTETANNLADVLDLGSKDITAPHWQLPAFNAENCLTVRLDDIWKQLLGQARKQGWPV